MARVLTRSLPTAVPPVRATAGTILFATTAVTVINSTTETELVSLVIPSQSFTQGRVARLHVAGTLLQGSTGTITVRVKANTQTITTHNPLTHTTSTGAIPWLNTALIQATSGNIQTAATAAMLGNTTEDLAHGSSTQPSTGALDISVTAQLSVASTSYSVTSDIAYLEQLR